MITGESAATLCCLGVRDLCLVDYLAVNEGVLHLDVRDVLGIVGQQILVQNHDVRQLAGLQTALDVLLKADIGTIIGEHP